VNPSPSLERQIIEGKDVNLASLLIPNYECPQTHTITTNSLEVNVPGRNLQTLILTPAAIKERISRSRLLQSTVFFNLVRRAAAFAENILS
jgi:hypothetical protein